MRDAIVIGGSFAGLAAALQLARARRRVLVVDAGLPRNRFAAHSHGFLGHDGRPPQEILDDAARQLLAYPTAAIRDDEADAFTGKDGFFVNLGQGGQLRARRLVLAMGVVDELPPIAGMRERWGTTVLHCPYCHGFEVAGRALGVIANHARSAHQATLLPDWGRTTYFTQGIFEPDEHEAARLEARGVRIERTPVVELVGTAPALEAVRLSDGRLVPVGAVFTAPRTHLPPLAAKLGCALDEGAQGPYIRVDEWKQTTVPGVYAAGDVASAMHNVTLASAAGVLAGIGVHQSLVAEEAVRAPAAVRGAVPAGAPPAQAAKRRVDR